MGIGSMIVGVSSRCTEAEIRKFMEAGLNDYHEKPLNNAKLSSILDKINPSFTRNQWKKFNVTRSLFPNSMFSFSFFSFVDSVVLLLLW